MDQRSNRRGGFIRSQLVEPYKQVRLGLVFLMLNIAFSAVFLVVYGYYVSDIYNSVTHIMQLSTVPEDQSSAMLNKFLWPIIVGGMILFLFVCSTLYVSVSYTHRIYGPLVSIRRFLDELLAGNIPKPVKLRKSDHLQDLVTRLNSVAERMSSDQHSGAMVAIHRFLDDWAAGKKPQEITLREGDQLQELAGKLNQLAKETFK